MTTVREFFGLRDVAELMRSDRVHKPHPDYSFVNPDLVVGIECEIERWPEDVEYRMPGFSFTADGSLRNNGYEAISAPTKSKYIPNLLRGLFSKFDISEKNYSQRCSTHVHVNCQNLTLEQVKMLALVYQVLERPLFGFIGNDRQDNIFCVPWYQCNMSVDFAHKFLYDAGSVVRNWQKYTALNILPLREKGTVEFRHLEGTCDIDRIVAWLNIIGSMHKYACDNSYAEFKEAILHMNSVSNYGAFIEDVLGEHAKHLTELPTYQRDIALGVVDCKLAMLNEGALPERVDPPRARLGDLLRQMALETAHENEPF